MAHQGQFKSSLSHFPPHFHVFPPIEHRPMGVKDLWKVLRPAGSTQSITRLAVDGFNNNLNGNRGLRIGIDASIWLGHTEKIKGRNKMGKNHTLRTLFFRCADLLEAPLLPLFVFDGKDKPLIKRGKVSYFKKPKLIEDMQELLEAFGFEWHQADGEAEAELAYLNSIGVIDAVWTDDVDVFLFGAVRVLRNPSNTLSGNATNPILNAEGRDDGKHVMVLSARAIESHSEIQLTRAGLILIALLRGGDYDEGVPQIGIQIAYGLARCGFGDSLLNGVESLKGKQLNEFLTGWRDAIVTELRSDSQGFLRKKHAMLAQSFPADFPKLDVLAAYVKPVVSGEKTKLPRLDWNRKLDISALAGVCKRSFGWDDDTLLKKFASLVWPGAAMRILRDTVVSMDHIVEMQNVHPDAPATGNSVPPHASSLIVGTHGRQRKHPSTDYLPELRVDIDTTSFMERARLGLGSTQQHSPVPQRTRPASSGEPAKKLGGLSKGKTRMSKGKTRMSPVDTGTAQSSNLRLWLPVCIVHLAVPRLAHAHALDHTEQRPSKRRRTDDPAPSNSTREAAGKSTRETAVSTSGDSAATRGHGSTSRRAQVTMNLTSASDSNVIVISDSEDAASDEETNMAELRPAVIDLT